MPNVSGDTKTVVIKQGQTLSQIAQQNGVSVEKLMKANGIKDPSKIRAGAKITIPISTSSPLGSGDTYGKKKTEAPNSAMEQYTFTPEEVEINSTYSKAKIKESENTPNAKEKEQTAALGTDPYSGYITITMKKDMNIEELKKLFNIPNGVLKRCNDLKFKMNRLPDEHHEKDFTKHTVKEGDTIIVPPGSFEYKGFIKELANGSETTKEIKAKIAERKEIQENQADAAKKIKKAFETNEKEKKEAVSLSTDEKAEFILIKLKKGMKAEELKKMFNIPNGILSKYNELEFEWGDLPDGHHFKDYTNSSFCAGDTVRVPVSRFEYEGNWFTNLFK